MSLYQVKLHYFYSTLLFKSRISLERKNIHAVKTSTVFTKTKQYPSAAKPLESK